jgi:uncharacterized protein (TIGR00251 family)
VAFNLTYPVILSGALCREGPMQLSGCKQIAEVLRFAQDDKKLSMLAIHESPDAVTFAIKVRPRAKNNALTGELGNTLKVSLTTPPVEGRANQACIEFFAKLLKVPRSSVTIASGQTSRNKVNRVAGVTEQYVRDRLLD